MRKEAILDEFSFYAEATDAERRAIHDAAVPAHLDPGEVFYRQGELGRDFGLVGRGDIRVYKTAPNGRELTLYHVRDRQPCLVNMLCVFLDRPAMASATAEAATDAVLVPAAVFRTVLATSSALQRFVFETMAARLVDVMELVEEVTVRRMDARLTSWLLKKFAEQLPDNAIMVTHDELAAELGTAREVVSRLLKEFERKGAIRLSRGRIILVDARVLTQIATDVGAAGP